MTVKQNRFSLWLIPSNTDFNYLRYFIADLANETHTSPFNPHCTLMGGINTCPENDKLARIAQLFRSPMKARAKSIDYSKDLWKSVYIQLTANREIMDLQSKIHQCLFPHNPYIFNPHISLAYSEEQINKKAQLARRIGVKSTFIFDRIVVMKTGDEVHRWEKIFEVKMGVKQ